MKKLLLSLLSLCAIGHAQTITFADPQFKAALLSTGGYTTATGGNPVNIDTNNNNEIEISEALLIKRIVFTTAYFTNAAGLEHFTNLVEFYCDSAIIQSSINVSTLVNLEKLTINNSYLSSVTVSALTNLKELTLNHNFSMGSLNVSGLTNLTRLSCYNSHLGGLTLGSLPNLKVLNCWDNYLQTINLSGTPNLEELDCGNNPLISLDVSTLTQLKKLGCYGSTLHELDVTNLVNLTDLSCGANSLTNINTSNLTNLQNLEIAGEGITVLDLTDLPNLVSLDCSGANIPSLDFTLAPNLKYVSFGSSALASVVLNPILEVVSIYSCNIASYDFNSLPLLRNLTVQGCGGLTAIDFSNCPLVNDLQVMSNPDLEYINMKNGRIIDYYGIAYNPNLVYICAEGYPNLQNQLAGEPQGNSVYLHVNPYCSFAPGGVNNVISGQFKFDADIDGCSESDPIFYDANLNVFDGSNNVVYATNYTQDFRVYAQTGTYTLTPVLENPSYFNVTPPVATLNFTELNTQQVNQNFCVTANGIHPDAEVLISSTSMARPGFDWSYQVIYRNKGNQVLSGTITLNFDDAHTDYLSSTPPAFASGNALTWNFESLSPWETRVIEVKFNHNGPMDEPPLNAGDALSFYASMGYAIPDVAAYTSTAELHQPISNSFDPNDKACLEGNTISPEMIGDYVHYNINFENIGTASAVNVVVKDVIDTAKFDIATLQVIYSSHPMVTKINDNLVEFIFENIELPGTAGDNKGNVVFKIKTRPTLVLGNTISNKAEIFFDYNFPIETNEATSTFASLANTNFRTDATIGIAPNPTKDKVNVKANSNIKSLELFDMQGRLLQTSIKNERETSIDVSAKSHGVYFLKVTTENGSKTEKIIKK